MWTCGPVEENSWPLWNLVRQPNGSFMSEVVSWWKVKYCRNVTCFRKHQPLPPVQTCEDTLAETPLLLRLFFLQTGDVYKGLSHTLAARTGAPQESTRSRLDLSGRFIPPLTRRQTWEPTDGASPCGSGSCVSSPPLQWEAEESTTGPRGWSEVAEGQSPFNDLEALTG